MKVLNLRCGNDHRFEGWFASEEDFQAQESRGLVQCPVCAEGNVVRLPSAPRLNVSNLRDTSPSTVPDARSTLQTQWLRAVHHMLATTEDVGERFPEEARRIHYGEVEERGIRGQASREAAEELREEGIDVVAVPMPAALKGPVH
ncbi:MAG TPA: DUF1178 family protein [Caldimonas sp.]